MVERFVEWAERCFDCLALRFLDVTINKIIFECVYSWLLLLLLFNRQQICLYGCRKE
jgi:hypothetical protein